MVDRRAYIRIPVLLLSASLTTVAIFPAAALAGNTGSISGLVESEDGRGIEGTLVVVRAANMFAITDADGYYVIMGVPPGKYEVRAGRVGYGEITSSNVTVTADKRTRLNFTFYFWHPSFTIYEREPLFDEGVEIIRAEDIDRQTADDFEDLILRVPGVVDTGGE